MRVIASEMKSPWYLADVRGRNMLVSLAYAQEPLWRSFTREDKNNCSYGPSSRKIAVDIHRSSWSALNSWGNSGSHMRDALPWWVYFSTHIVLLAIICSLPYVAHEILPSASALAFAHPKVSIKVLTQRMTHVHRVWFCAFAFATSF